MTAGVDDPLLALALRSSSAWSAFLPRAASCAAAESEALLGVVLAIRINIASLRPRTVTPFSLSAYDWATRNADNLSDFNWSDAVGVELDDVVDLVFSEADFAGMFITSKMNRTGILQMEL